MADPLRSEKAAARVQVSLQELEKVLMGLVGGLDIHRQQITFDWVDRDSGGARRGRISPADRVGFRTWLGQFDGEVEVVCEGCTGWRFVAEECRAAGGLPTLGGPYLGRSSVCRNPATMSTHRRGENSQTTNGSDDRYRSRSCPGCICDQSAQRSRDHSVDDCHEHRRAANRVAHDVAFGSHRRNARRSRLRRHKLPWDAFWGMRYAVVHDPDGNGVDLFSPLPGA
jgi:hypothetical protein